MKPIVAISTSPVKSAIGIIRISFGSLSINKVNLITKKLFNKLLIPRYFTYVNILCKNLILDKGLIVLFKKPCSYTGENILEFHGHGNFLNLKIILNFFIKILKKFKIRLAYPGEFTKRAFLNKKINLFQLENIYNIINSNNYNSLKLVHKSFKLNTFLKLKRIIKLIKYLLYFLENKKFLIYKKKYTYNINYKLNYILKNTLKVFKKKTLYKKNFLITLFGSVNSGKSTISNLLIKENFSIISPIEGTTRDIIQKEITINNTAVKFIDTAGIRLTNNIIEKLSIRLSLSFLKKSNILLYVLVKENDFYYFKLKKKLKNSQYLILIFNKIDLNKKNSNLEIFLLKKENIRINLSAKFGLGIIFLFFEINRLVFLFNKFFVNIFLTNNLKSKNYNPIKNILKSIFYNKKNNLNLLINELKISFKKINHLINNKVKLKSLNVILNKLCIGK